MALAAIVAAIINATVKTKSIRLNALPVTICCCPIITSSFFIDGFALHPEPGSKRDVAHWQKDQFLVGQCAYYYLGLVPRWRLEGSLMHPAAEAPSCREGFF